MAGPLSDDLRERVCAAVAGGLSGRQAGKRFKVSASSVSRRRRRLRDTGSGSPDALGGDRRSERIEAHAELLLARMGAEPDTTLEEYQVALAMKTGERFALSTIWRFFDRHDITHKKRLRMRPSRIALMSPSRARPGSKVSAISIRTSWSSSTRPLPAPKWRDCGAARHAASAAGRPFPTATGSPPPLPLDCAATLSLHPCCWMVR